MHSIAYVYLFCHTAATVQGFFINSPVNLIKSQALFSTIRNRLSFEILDPNNLFNEADHILYHPHFDLFVFTSLCFLGAAAIFYMIDENLSVSTKKLRNVQEYTSVEHRINIFIWTLLFIMFKDVGSAF